MANGLKGIKTVRDFELAGKVVFLRLDLNVPMENGKITDENRITASLPTIKYCMEQGAKLVMASHLGRPKTKDDTEFSLEPVAKRLQDLLNAEVILVEEPDSDAPKHLLPSLKPNQLILLENVRFEEGETKDSIEFAQKIANYSDIYINDAFGASHRAHATIHALPSVMKDKGIGFLIEKEITMLDSLLQNPKRPYIAVMGGAKVSDKIAVIERLMDVVDGFIVGGAMAYTFLKAQGLPVGKSLVENDKLKYAKEMIERIEARNKTILLPVDHVATKGITDTAHAHVTNDVAIAEDELGVDIGPKTIKNFSAALREAGTIFWNGPMGIFENPAFAKGTFGVAAAIAESDAVKIVGGGDSAAAAEASGFAGKMTHISTGGGASLEYLQGDKLPGLEILRTRIRA
ncbi:phosphoglycerate kinase [Bdellovibrio bacteriovorus]|uniref:Phosphoglycerate kinase n=1 Tax=Bdellovibrio bacteriovorus str. Tiberius TaxID=1069642 RepID=K7ZEN8_BDEBC|nr:phosphoglycerate kinase [Bdellovibrio bacteriovorus]AFY00692.1 phosphoglycerate kinase [Bdellovibrio bacteriovorus str. Tiberius]